MQTRQTAHIIPIVKNHKPLVGSGGEKALAYSVGDEFIYKANDDGVVTGVDEVNQLVFIEYKNGNKSVIDLSPKNSRSSDGFYVTVQLKSKVKKGSKFKKNQILAQDTSFFSEDDATFNPGRLAKVAIAPLDLTFEDSSVISQELANDMASYITYAKPISLSANANIEKFKKKGESIKTSEPLMIFEEVFDDDTGSVSKLLDKLGAEFSETIEEFSKSTVTSKYSGEILDVKIYYNKELEEYSDSIRKMLNTYIKLQKQRSDKIKDVNDDRVINIPPVEKVLTNKVNGIEFDGILIIYYIRTLDTFRPGSKVTVSVALKSIVSSIFEEGEEPYSESSPNENIELVISPLSLSSRMVVDTYKLGYSNKALITLKNRIKEILDN